MYQKKYRYDIRGSEWRETTEDKVERDLNYWYKGDASQKFAQLKNGEIIPIPSALLRWIPER